MKALIVFSAVISFFIIMPLSYMLSDIQPPYEFDVDKSYIVPHRAIGGRQLTVHWHVKRVNRICPGTITRFIVDAKTGARISYDPTLAAKSIDLKDNTFDRTFYLPEGIAPGVKYYYAEGNYACNPLQRFYPLLARTPRLTFEVIE